MLKRVPIKIKTKKKSQIKEDNIKTEGNIYDKVFKENIEPLIVPLAAEKLNLKIKSRKLLKDKLLVTQEREVDFLYEIITDLDKKIILHIEVESNDNPDMVIRLAEYHAMIYRKYKLPIMHVVIYLGEEKSKMRATLDGEEIFTSFTKIELRDFNTEDLLSSNIPEYLILAVLSNYPKEEAEIIIQKVCRKLLSLVKNKAKFSKYLKQVLVLSRLRKLEDITIKILDDMPITYDIETDALYLRGIEKGAAKKEQEDKYLFVKDLLLETVFDSSKIARLARVTIGFVEKVKSELSNEKK